MGRQTNFEKRTAKTGTNSVRADPIKAAVPCSPNRRHCRPAQRRSGSTSTGASCQSPHLQLPYGPHRQSAQPYSTGERVWQKKPDRRQPTLIRRFAPPQPNRTAIWSLLPTSGSHRPSHFHVGPKKWPSSVSGCSIHTEVRVGP